MTPVDLIALVAGFAVALSLAGTSEPTRWLRRRFMMYHPMRSVLIAFIYAERVAVIGCVALLVAVLARRVRFGGIASPAEFLAACQGMALAAMAIQSIHALGLDTIWRKSGDPCVFQRSNWIWIITHLALGSLSIVVLWRAGRRAPGWVSTILLLVVWAGMLTPLKFIANGGLNLLGRLPTVGRGLAARLLDLPAATVYWLPYTAVATQFVNGHGRDWNWLEWTAVTLAAVCLLDSSYAYYFVLVCPPNVETLKLALIHGFWIGVACLVDLMVLHVSSSTWNRRVRSKYQGGRIDSSLLATEGTPSVKIFA